MCLFWPQRPLSLPLGWLGFCFQVVHWIQDSSQVITVFKKFASGSAHCSKSLAIARWVTFCSTVSSFETNFTETNFLPKSCHNGVYWTKWKPQLVGENSNYHSLVIQHGSMPFVNHQLFTAHGEPPSMFITLDWCPPLSELPKPVLNLHMVYCFNPESLLNHIISFWALMPKFMAKLDAVALLNFLSHHQCDTDNKNNNRFWPTASD